MSFFLREAQDFAGLGIIAYKDCSLSSQLQKDPIKLLSAARWVPS